MWGYDVENQTKSGSVCCGNLFSFFKLWGPTTTATRCLDNEEPRALDPCFILPLKSIRKNYVYQIGREKSKPRL